MRRVAGSVAGVPVELPVPAAEAGMTCRGGHAAVAGAGLRLPGFMQAGRVEPSPTATELIEKKPGRQPEALF